MSHRWKFVRAGGFDQVDITDGADLEALPELDQKLWVALACPITGIEFDERTLTLIDADGDKRIRAPELIAAIKWACAMVKDPDTLVPGDAELALADIDDGSDEGKLIKKTAKTMLKTLGKADAKAISVEDASAASTAFDKDPFNGDGVLPEASAGDAEDLKAAIRDILSTIETPELDRGGEPGITAERLEAFFTEAHAYVGWLEKGEAPEVKTLGDATAAAYAAFIAVKSKIGDYFARTKVAAYDTRALAAINGEERQYLELAAKDLDVTAAELEQLPICQVAADKPLALGKGVNPAWAQRMADLRANTVKPILGDEETLTEADWAKCVEKLAGFHAWMGEVVGVSVQKLGGERLKELTGGDIKDRLAALIQEDKDHEDQFKAIEGLERLVRLNRDLMALVNNFVSFRDFYSRKGAAMFQVGTLYLDTRACELVVSVDNAAKHATMAPLSNNYLVYCDCKNSKGETRQIAAAMTAGDVDNLMVGRNGIFYDRKGADWDATVTKIVENPISVRQAFWSPYKKALRMIEERINKRAADEAAASDTAMAGGVDRAATTTVGETPAADAPEGPKGIDIGTLAAIGVAIGGITAALGVMLEAFFGLGIWMPLGVLGLILAISGPSMAVAWLKLRKRNLGPLLDANGWAVNAMAIINVPLGASLTKEAELPPGSSRDLSDPFAEKRRPWGFYVALVLLLVAAGWSYRQGWFDRWLSDDFDSTRFFGADVAEGATPEEAAPEEAAPAE
ncbi:MAG: hypothetical protein AB7S26_16690 [Sandaracinaceae bacterium]